MSKSGEKEKLVFAPRFDDSEKKLNVNLRREVRSLSFSNEIVSRESTTEEISKSSFAALKEELEKNN